MSEDIFTVDKILKSRIRRGVTEYFIKWEGYLAKHNSWEPEENILDAGVITAFNDEKMQKVEEKRKKRSKSKKSALKATENLQEQPQESAQEDAEDLSEFQGKNQDEEAAASTEQPIIPISNKKDATVAEPEKWKHSSDMIVTDVVVNNVKSTIREYRTLEDLLKSRTAQQRDSDSEK